MGADIAIRWTVGERVPAAAFRVLASQASDRRELAVRAERDGSFAATDQRVASSGFDRVTYRLFYRESNGHWMLLAEESFSPPVVSRVTELRQPYPNPFNPIATIPFSVGKPQWLNLTIHDPAGRQVVTLLQQPMTAGVNRVTWNGRDANGRQVAAGVYFVRLRTTDELQTRKIVLAK
jgi:hypothetical protein